MTRSKKNSLCANANMIANGATTNGDVISGQTKDHHADIQIQGEGPSRTWESNGASLNDSLRSRAEDLDVLDPPHHQCLCAKSQSSFQVHQQFLEVYKDLRWKQYNAEGWRKDAGMNIEHADDDSMSGGTLLKLKRLAVSSNIGENNKSEDDLEYSSIGGSYANSLALLQDEGEASMPPCHQEKDYSTVG